jgi:D-sedoheptulose 7-phosphate isomerase
MKFPIKKYIDLNKFKDDYYKSFINGFSSIENKKLIKVMRILEKAYKNKNKKVMVCGNGGSAALANHFVCDHQKILYETKKIKPNMISLSANSALMTAISNDNTYEDVYSDQILQIGKKDDILITISSSGSSKNIVKAIQTAKKLKIYCISLTGFKGGLSKKIADVNLHIASQNYGIVESLHHTLMNIISQYLKNKYLSVNQTKKTYY